MKKHTAHRVYSLTMGVSVNEREMLIIMIIIMGLQNSMLKPTLTNGKETKCQHEGYNGQRPFGRSLLKVACSLVQSALSLG